MNRAKVGLKNTNQPKLIKNHRICDLKMSTREAPSSTSGKRRRDFGVTGGFRSTRSVAESLKVLRKSWGNEKAGADRCGFVNGDVVFNEPFVRICTGKR